MTCPGVMNSWTGAGRDTVGRDDSANHKRAIIGLCGVDQRDGREVIRRLLADG